LHLSAIFVSLSIADLRYISILLLKPNTGNLDFKSHLITYKTKCVEVNTVLIVSYD